MIITVNFPIKATGKNKPEKIRASTGFEPVTSGVMLYQLSYESTPHGRNELNKLASLPTCGFHTERLSHFVDYHFQPLVHKLPSFVKDTNDFLNKLLNIGNLPANSILVTLDVSSLYNNYSMSPRWI